MKLADNPFFEDFLQVANALATARQAVATVDAVHERAETAGAIVENLKTNIAVTRRVVRHGVDADDAQFVIRKAVGYVESSLTNAFFHSISTVIKK